MMPKLFSSILDWSCQGEKEEKEMGCASTRRACDSQPLSRGATFPFRSMVESQFLDFLDLQGGISAMPRVRWFLGVG